MAGEGSIQSPWAASCGAGGPAGRGGGGCVTGAEWSVAAVRAADLIQLPWGCAWAPGPGAMRILQATTQCVLEV